MTVRMEATAVGIPGRLETCDLALEAGTVTMIVGPNGAGKTSLLRALAAIEGHARDIRVDGEVLTNLPPARRGAVLAFLGASRDVTWPLRARDFIALGLPGKTDAARIDDVLRSLDAEAFAERRLDRLSTGERSRIMIARALVPRAGAVLLDEPCANLDPKWQIAILDRLRAEAQDGSAIVLSIHDLDLALQHGDRAIVMDRGAIVADGPPVEALSEDCIERVFAVRRESARWVRV